MRKDIIYNAMFSALFFFLPVSISISQFLLFVFVIMFTISAFKGNLEKERLKCFPEYIPFLLFLLFPLLSFPNSQLMFKSVIWFKRHLYAIMLIVLIPFLPNIKDRQKKLLAAYFIGATISSFVAVLQPFFGAEFNKPFKFDTYYVFSTGLLSHPLTYAETTSFALIIGIILFFKSQKTLIKIPLAVAIAVNFLGLIFSREKMPIIASIVFTFILLTILFFKLNKPKQVVGAILLLALTLLIIPNKQKVLWRFNATKIKSSISIRKAVWEKSIELFKQYPLTGAGFGTFSVTVDSWNKKSKQKLFHAHNNLLELLATTGLIGLAIFLLFHLSIFKDLILSLKNRFSLETLGILFVFMLYHFEGLTECTFKDTELNLQLFSMLALFYSLNCSFFKDKNKAGKKEKPS